MTAGREFASAIRSGRGTDASTLWPADRLTPARLYLISLLYALVAFAWATSGRRDPAFADAAAVIGAVAAVLTFALAVLLALPASRTDVGTRWYLVAVGAGASAAVQIAAFAVVRGERAIDWNPLALQLVASLAPVALLASSLHPWGDDARRRAALSGGIAFLIGTLGLLTAAMSLVAAVGAQHYPHWRLALAVIAGGAGFAAASQRWESAPSGSGAAWSLLCVAWTASALSHPLAIWFDTNGWLAYGRWLLPVGTLALVTLAARALAPGRPTASLPAPAPPAWLVTYAGPLTIAGVALGILALVGALVWEPTLTLDVVVLAALTGLLVVVRMAASLAAERARVSELAEAARAWQRVASVDALTGLPNRAALMRRLTEEVERSLRYQQPLTVCFVDVDRFKSINDRYGHAAGDLVLREIGERLRSTARIIDLVGRFGGEEFLVLVPGTWTADAFVLAERLRTQVSAEPVAIPGDARIDVTISLGLAGLPEHAATLDGLLGRADLALYRAKRAGRNRVHLYSPADET